MDKMMLNRNCSFSLPILYVSNYEGFDECTYGTCRVSYIQQASEDPRDTSAPPEDLKPPQEAYKTQTNSIDLLFPEGSRSVSNSPAGVESIDDVLQEQGLSLNRHLLEKVEDVLVGAESRLTEVREFERNFDGVFSCPCGPDACVKAPSSLYSQQSYLPFTEFSSTCFLPGDTRDAFISNDTLALQTDYCSLTRQHTLCRYSSDTAGPRCKKPLALGIHPPQREEILQIHNRLRSHIASGKETRGNPGPQPSATSMLELQWDSELAEIAQAWANQCTFQHDCGTCRQTGRFVVGQNIFISGSTVASKPNWEGALGAFYDEVIYMNPQEVLSFEGARGVGHYTQMVWGSTQYVGCGFIQYQDGSFTQNFHVCNYGAAGNFIGRSIYDIGRPCSKCPSGTVCSNIYPGLCSPTPDDSPAPGDSGTGGETSTTPTVPTKSPGGPSTVSPPCTSPASCTPGAMHGYPTTGPPGSNGTGFPGAPEKPGSTFGPGIFGSPGRPGISGTPGRPGFGSPPGTTGFPGSAGNPAFPERPPTHPGIGTNPGNAGIPGFGNVPGITNVPGTSGFPGFTVPGIGNIPGFNVPGIGEIPGFNVPGIGEIPGFNVPGTGEIPGFNVPGIGEIPGFNVPGIGEIPGFNVPGIGQGPGVIRPPGLGQGPGIIRPPGTGETPGIIRPPGIGQGPGIILPPGIPGILNRPENIGIPGTLVFPSFPGIGSLGNFSRPSFPGAVGVNGSQETSGQLTPVGGTESTESQGLPSTAGGTGLGSQAPTAPVGPNIGSNYLPPKPGSDGETQDPKPGEDKVCGCNILNRFSLSNERQILIMIC
ncbi:uncharacterized protein [Palaemon carinicauda]|uniref:uncharacterized protein n=1 Tax=Palaemon carinicauda TaxID=392227 RepID=UPI0035B6592E